MTALSVLEDLFWIVVFVATIAGPLIAVALIADAIFDPGPHGLFGRKDERH